MMKIVKMLGGTLLAIVMTLSVTACSNTSKTADDILADIETAGFETKVNDNTDTYNYKNHLGTWYYTRFSDPEQDDFEPLTITDKGNNKAEIKWYDGSIEEITFISDNVAHGNTSISEYCAVEVPGGLSEERKNVPVVNVYDFTPVNDKESMYVCARTTDTDRLVVAEWQSAVRSVEEVFSNVAFGSGQTENVQSGSNDSNERDKFQKRYDALNSKSIKDAPQQEMNIQSGELYDEWDSLLNDVYQYLKTIKTSSEFETIKSDEVAWIKKKEAAVEASRSEYAGGSMAPLAANTTAIKYTKDRCNYLISLIN